MAKARVAFLARKSADTVDTCAVFRNTFAIGGSTNCRMGIRTAMPAAFTMKNIPNWCKIWRERESGYVQNRFNMKLLMTAQMNDIVPA